MSDKLYKLGKWIFSHKWRVLSAWFVTLVILGGLAATFQKPYTTQTSIPGLKSQAALDTLAKEFPGTSKGTGDLVFAAQKGHTILENKTAVEAVLTQVSKVQGVSTVVSPFTSKTISQNGQIAFASIGLSTTADNVTTATKDKVLQIIADSSTTNLKVAGRGDMVSSKPAAGATEGLGILIAAMVLMLTFGSLVAAGMPLLIAIIAVVLGTLSVSTATGFFSLSATTPILALMLGLAVGIDYSLFLIVRYVKFLKEGISPKEAAGRMLATAGNAVIFAALTVVIALAAMVVIGVPFLSAMGLFAALTVAFAALAALTIVPALLSFAKFKVVNKSDRKRIAAHITSDENKIARRSFGHKWVSMVTKRPIVVVIIAIVGLGLLALPATKLYLGLPDDSTAAKTSTQREAYDLLSQGFGPGFNGPLLVVATLPNGLSQSEQQAKVASIASKLEQDKGIVSATPAGISKDGKTAILQAYPTTGPGDKVTRQIIAHLNKNAAQIAGANTSVAITGATAIAVDVDTKLSHALPLYMIVVVGLSLLILMAVFRSVLVPIKATLGFVLTILATLGIIVMFFQWGWLGLIPAGPVLSFLPILATGILFGLAMDYQFFLVSGMHEAYTRDKNKDATKAVIEGFSHGSKVVTAAALIMIGVFSGFILTPDTTIRSIGFALAVGVFIDAFIVRMTIVPAVMTLFGRSAWWLPVWLGKVIPNLSIEGDESTFQNTEKKIVTAKMSN